MPQTITRNLFVREGSSDKVYNVTLEPRDTGWVVNVQRGRRGSRLIEDTKTPLGPIDYYAALNIFNHIVNLKTRKGYMDNPNFINTAQPERLDKKTTVKVKEIDEGFVLQLDEDDLLFKM